MITPATAAATAPSCAVKPVALFFPKVIPLPLLDVVVAALPAAVVVAPMPPRPVAVAAAAVVLAPLPKPVPERPDPVVAAGLLPPVLTPETGYPAFVQSVSRV